MIPTWLTRGDLIVIVAALLLIAGVIGGTVLAIRQERRAQRQAEAELDDWKRRADLWLGRGPDQFVAEWRDRLAKQQYACPYCGLVNRHDASCWYARPQPTADRPTSLLGLDRPGHQANDVTARLRGDLDRQRRGGRGGAA